MGKIKVLVAEDSDYIRRHIVSVLNSDKEIQVIGEARNGHEAVEMARKLEPDLVTMDIVMPVMGGLDAIEIIMAQAAVPILVLTSTDDASVGFSALSKGALEVFSKSELAKKENKKEFLKKIKLLARVKVITHIRKSADGPRKTGERNGFGRVVGIASSTGGPKALSTLLSQLPKDFPAPVLIAQHISDGFVSGMAAWLKDVSPLQVKIGTGGETISAGTVYISESERDMKVDSSGRIIYLERQDRSVYHPSCDILLSSIADSFGAGGIGVILTGMGDDGAKGIKKIKDAGGATIAQDEGTSVVFGMPKEAIGRGCIDKVLPIHEIGGEVARLAARD